MGGGDMGAVVTMMQLLGGNGTSGAVVAMILAGLLGGAGTPGSAGGVSIGTLLGGLFGNDTSLSGILGSLFGGGGPGGLNITTLLGSGNPLAVLGGLKERSVSPRQADIAAGLAQIAGNYVNWTSFIANETAAHGTSDLAYVVEGEKGYLLDFTPFTETEWPQFNTVCANYTAILGLGLITCVATDTNSDSSSSIVAGLRICDPLGLFGQPCPTDNPEMQYAARMHISTSRATTAYSLSNATILSISDQTDKQDYPINVKDFFTSFISAFQQSKLFAALFFQDNSATSSVTSQLVLSLAADFQYGGEGPLSGDYQLRNLMTYAIVIGSLMQDEVANSGRQFVTRIAYTIHISPATLYAFITLGTVILLWNLVVLGWSSSRLTANTSGFPEIDFASKWAAGGATEGLSNAVSRSVVQRLGKGTNIFLGEGLLEGDVGSRDVVVLDTAPVPPLKKHVLYS
jgi:hypothetical protein